MASAPERISERMHRSLEELVEKYTRARDRFRAKRRELGDIARETSFYRDAVAFYEQLQQEPRFRKMADLAENVESSQFMFTLSLSLLMLTQYIAVAAPEHFYYLYAAIIYPLIVSRYILYYKLRWAYFLYDFCYFSHMTITLHTFVYPQSSLLYKLAFMFSNGPVAWAIIIWRNSLVFHSFDKMCTFFLHFLPIVTSFCSRWYGTSVPEEETTFTVYECFLVPIAGYTFWQVCYMIHVDILCWPRIVQEGHETSSKWFFGRDKDSAVTQGALKLLRKWGFFGDEEQFDANLWKSRFSFYGFQFIYTLLTFIPACACYYFKSLHIGFAIGAMLVGCNNGATFYLSRSFANKRLEDLANRKVLKEKKAQKEQTAAAQSAADLIPSTSSMLADTSKSPNTSDILRSDDEEAEWTEGDWESTDADGLSCSRSDSDALGYSSSDVSAHDTTSTNTWRRKRGKMQR